MALGKGTKKHIPDNLIEFIMYKSCRTAIVGFYL